MMADWMPVLVAQTWQITLLIVVVAATNRWLRKSRPHLSHLLWLVVLIKCVTPPMWSSPSGLFCWLQPARETIREPLAVEPSQRIWSELLATARERETTANVSGEDDRSESMVEGEELLLGSFDVTDSVVKVPSQNTTDKVDWPRVLFGTWASVSLMVIGVAVVRWLRCWRMLRSAPQRECPELSAQLDLLAKRLRLRRRVRLIVTESRIGPAVIGLFRTTVLLPALIVDRLALRSRHAPCDEPNAQQRVAKRPAHHAERDGYADSLLTPILAHELLHVRRGDLWVGLLQTVAQAVWWCHPLVWWVNRLTTREAERCCDEEVLAELGCDPAAYARALVDVLELKRELKPVPIFPGVRPVEITSQRLERIMELGQGCRRRTPWWCWLIAALAAAASWPGAAFVVTADEKSPVEFKETPPLSDASASKSDKTNSQPGADLKANTAQGRLVYEVRALSGSEEEIRKLAKRLGVGERFVEDHHLHAPVAVPVDQMQRLFVEAQSNRLLSQIAFPKVSRLDDEKATVGETNTTDVPYEVIAADGKRQLMCTAREYGWRLTMHPLSVGEKTTRLGVENWQAKLDNDHSVTININGTEKVIPGVTTWRTNTTVELERGQLLVFPIRKLPQANATDVMLLTLQIHRVKPNNATPQTEPTPTAASLPIRGVGVNSDAGIVGEVVVEAPADKPAAVSEVLEKAHADEFWPGIHAWLSVLGPIPDGNIAEIRVEGNRLISTDEFLAMIKSKPGEPINEELLRKDVKTLLANRRFMSVFPRVQKSDKGPVLVFRVIERGVLEQVEFSGNKLVATEDLEKVAELKVGSPFDVSACGEAVRRLTKYYRSKGFSTARSYPKFELTKNGNRLDYKVTFVIAEGAKGKVPPPLAAQKTAAEGAKLELDGLGQLLWQHGSWFVVVRPEPGKKLIDSGETPNQFRSDGQVGVRLSKTAQGFSSKDQILILADEFKLSSNEFGEQIRLDGEVVMDGNGFRSTCKSMALSFQPQQEGLVREPQITAMLRGEVQVRSKTNNGATELRASSMLLYLNGTALTHLKSDDNGIVAVLRDPPARNQELIRRRQDILAIDKSVKRIAVHFAKEPLKRVLAHLAKESGRNIHLDPAGLVEEALTETVLVTLNLNEVSLQSALTLLLDPLNLGYRVEESGVIVVTSQQRLKGQPVVRTYSVADLAVPVPKRVVLKALQNAGANKEEAHSTDRLEPLPTYRTHLGIIEGLPPSEGRMEEIHEQFRSLSELITATCQPGSWESVGGTGQIKANDSTLSLVVRATADVHSEITDLLEQLRRLHDMQSVMQVETLTVPDDFWQQVGKDFDVISNEILPKPQPAPKDKPASRHVARLSRKEAALLRSAIRLHYGSKMTLFNGQEAELIFKNNLLEMRLGLKPVVSADRKAVRLQFATVAPQAVLDFSKLPAVVFDAGQSLLIDVTDVFPLGPTVGVSISNQLGVQLTEGVITSGGLLNAADHDRLFKNAGPTGRTLLLITGDVLIAEEEEVQSPVLGIPK